MIRPGTIDDLDAVMKLVKAWPSHYTPAAYPYIESDFLNLRSYVWDEHGEVLGFMIWMADAYEIEMLWLAVHPKALRRRIATRIVEAVISTATSQRVAILKTTAPDSTILDPEFKSQEFVGTIKFFQRLGFRIAGRLESYWEKDNHCVVLHRQIAPSQ